MGKDPLPLRSRLTSLKHVNPANAPDDFERASLVAFAGGLEEASGIATIEGQPYLRYMVPLHIEPPCLQCHGREGYQVGEVRGGLSAAVPMAEEWEIMKRHARIAFELLHPIEFLRPAIDIPYCHHEKWDGSGYPRGLKGEEIPFAARIFSVVDVYDALTSDRPYRPAWPKEKVLEYLQERSGTEFDRQVIQAFLDIAKSW